MNKQPTIQTLLVSFSGLLLLLANFTFAQGDKKIVSIPKDGNLYLNPELGDDMNEGTKESPLKSLSVAADRISRSTGKGSITIYLSKGVYGLIKTVKFNPVNWHFSEKDRLLIRAEKLPDDTEWNPADMPVIVSAMPFDIKETNDKKQITGAFNYGLHIQTSHVTLQGLRIMGEPVHESPSKGILIRNYPIMWDGKDLEDLRVTQCLFLGNRIAIPNHLGILASGKALVVDHCVFYGVKDAVVMWNTPAEKCEMHHNLIVNTYGAIVWTWSTSQDFKFYNNIISNANIIWVLDKEEKNTFTIENSIIIGFNELVNKGGGAADFGEKANPDKLKFGKDVIFNKEGSIDIEQDQTQRNYLHLKPGTPGANLGAGLFTKK